ncbi:hypothetical protein N7G274_009895 [Stereocaulon virgatum]|uniref:UDENN domain-containing protein n=1 Tax=Stereocaulon virgatum TaxID=373712 RepID=A0ABR3ZXC8_9LECA
MTSVLSYRPSNSGTTGSTGAPLNRQTSLSSFPSTRTPSNPSIRSNGTPASNIPPIPRPRSASSSSQENSTPSTSSARHSPPRQGMSRPARRLKSQYPANSTEQHVEYILVASFHVDRGPVMEHQYPGAISGDGNFLAELMLPDQVHNRKEDWTIFFLHKEGDTGEDDAAGVKDGDEGDETNGAQNGVSNEDSEARPGTAETEGDAEGGQGPPLIYVLNLVNTKHDASVKRGAVVKAMAICTRHPFLHIYKPLLLLALEEYFKAPYRETLESLYEAVNSMDLSLMPRLTMLERHILQASDAKDLFVEKFDQMIQQRMAEEASNSSTSPDSPSKSSTDMVGHRPRYTVPRDTHEFESKVIYNQIPVPIKIPTGICPETVGDFSFIKLIQTFSSPHAASPQPFALHPHLTTSGAYTHPIIVLVNALLTQKRVIFLGHNRPSGEVAGAVLAACALASGSVLRGFTRHAFPYTDLTKIDELLLVPGFIAGVTNPTFANHPEWWDLLCDVPTGRMKISSRIEQASMTDGLVNFQQQNPGYAPNGNGIGGNPTSLASNGDATGDAAFMESINSSILSRHGEAAIRSKWRDYILKFTRIAAAFEESVYGASALYIGASEADSGAYGVHGHGYVWPDDTSKARELGANVWRIEGWRLTRSYYAFIQDLAALWERRPIRSLDLAHQHDRLRSVKLSHEDSAAIYLALSASVNTYDEICQLLCVTPESNAGLFYISLGLFHPDAKVRTATVDLLERIMVHEAGRHFWGQLGRFQKLAFFRVKKEDLKGSENGDSPIENGVSLSMDARLRGRVGRAS